MAQGIVGPQSINIKVGLGAAAAHAGGAAAAARRCRKLPPPATLPLLGGKGYSPCRRRHLFMAATCLSHALYGSLPLELTTRCREGRGGRDGSGVSMRARCTTVRIRLRHVGCAGGDTATPPAAPPTWKHFWCSAAAWGHTTSAWQCTTCKRQHIWKELANASCGTPPRPDAATAGAAQAHPHPQHRRRPACVSRLLQIDGWSALLRKQCSRVPRARPQRLQGQPASW